MTVRFSVYAIERMVSVDPDIRASWLAYNTLPLFCDCSTGGVRLPLVCGRLLGDVIFLFTFLSLIEDVGSGLSGDVGEPCGEVGLILEEVLWDVLGDLNWIWRDVVGVGPEGVLY